MTCTLISISGCDHNGSAANNALLWLYLRSQRVVDLAHLVAAKWPGAEAVGSGDPLEDFCKDNPETDECRVYEA
jgi:hypothetical protein